MRPANLDTVLLIRIDRGLRAALRGAAQRRGTNASALVRAAITASVETDDPSSTPPAAPVVALQVAA
ncbi:hypothetical protein [Methylobacterium sp. GC_Met_2]|uniref:hypothetical protein n=1 Tax=Methylobacterium sp. GC_Met_2 TaxID=2937376 RepID=UPI00226AFFCD|nr:hypothetical protein [Methylobacterium sp. GC_Met_2]